MPLFKIKEESLYKLAIWEIKEPESFFMEKTGLTYQSKWEHRRLEFQASRYLLKLLDPNFPFDKVNISKNGKPFLPGQNAHFSITHSFPYVGVAIASIPIGIDVQTYQEKITRLQQKFLSDQEKKYFNNDIRQITLAWAAKEAVFKWSDLSGIDFKQHMPIRNFQLNSALATMEISFEKAVPASSLHLSGSVEENFGWMVTLPTNTRKA
jgi:phosphopantetheinyl transferase